GGTCRAGNKPVLKIARSAASRAIIITPSKAKPSARSKRTKTRNLWQPERAGGIGFRHHVDFGLRESLLQQQCVKRRKTLRVQWIPGLSQMARKNRRCRPDLANGVHVILDSQFRLRAQQTAVIEFDERAFARF